MNTTSPALNSRRTNRKQSFPGTGTSPRLAALLIGVVLAGQVTACDFCLRLPRVPFDFDHPAAIEVAIATQAAAEQGELDLNPDVTLTTTAENIQKSPLSDVSPRQLITQWIRTRPATGIRSLRCTIEVIFVDVDYACSLDIRFGEILEGNARTGPADVRLMTTKAGFWRLLEEGLVDCELRQLAAIDAGEGINRQQLQRLFPSAVKPTRPGETYQQANASIDSRRISRIGPAEYLLQR